MATHFGMPFRIDASGRTASASRDAHIRDLIEAVIFTSTGERVNRYEFGSGAAQLVFQPAGEQVVAAVEYMLQGALQQHLGHLIEVRAVDARVDDATLSVTVSFRVLTEEVLKAVRVEGSF